MGKRSRVTRYVINKSFVYDEAGSEPVKPGLDQAAHTESGSFFRIMSKEFRWYRGNSSCCNVVTGFFILVKETLIK